MTEARRYFLSWCIYVVIGVAVNVACLKVRSLSLESNEFIVLPGTPLTFFIVWPMAYSTAVFVVMVAAVSMWRKLRGIR